jgi:hypothetical protein
MSGPPLGVRRVNRHDLAATTQSNRWHSAASRCSTFGAASARRRLDQVAPALELFDLERVPPTNLVYWNTSTAHDGLS